MFLDLFYGLRDEGVPTSIQEWQMLMTALEKGMHGTNLLSFYHLSRATLIKSEAYFDAFDRVFARVFKGVEGELPLSDELEQWLNDPKDFDGLTDEQRAALEHLDADELMRYADAAMYQAKQAGGECYQFYRPDMNSAALRRIGLGVALQRAIRDNEFELHYQPQIDLKTGLAVGLEALVRW